ncbi:hypothetical protein AO370_1313 [Moraxella catarrhalis]|uniref:Uncharacterized protein n=1 Tax=Moraxella catarrhalis TaxID=480 RepID=A0AB36DMU3_MORCA|nr:hypothetical protein AO381_1519 [Moraxella catarrhalis]OAV25236.1 hypothetical protein AO370_1313 [Moraxella catarrhalis]
MGLDSFFLCIQTVAQTQQMISGKFGLNCYYKNNPMKDG